jgi:hypothetical protein
MFFRRDTADQTEGPVGRANGDKFTLSHGSVHSPPALVPMRWRFLVTMLHNMQTSCRGRLFQNNRTPFGRGKWLGRTFAAPKAPTVWVLLHSCRVRSVDRS